MSRTAQQAPKEDVMPHYVVTEPESIRGVYDSWDECKAAIDGVKGAKHQKA
jgi:hypothetical protein